MEIKKYKRELDDLDSIRFAIWFHDIIYNPKEKNNEENSADKRE